MHYSKLLLEFTFRRSLMRTDLWSAVFTAVGPAIFWLLGREVPADLTTSISLLVAALVTTTLVVRFFTAPYFLWKADQEEISRLKDELASPQRNARKALMEQFAAEKFQLMRQLMSVKGDMRAYNDAAQVGEETASRLYPLAQPFLLDPDFKRYWFTFEKNMKSLSALHSWRRAKTTIDREDEARGLVRFSFHHMLATGAIDSMILSLSSEKEAAKQAHDKAMSYIDQWYPNVDLSFALPDRRRWDEINWYHSDEEPVAVPTPPQTNAGEV